MSDLFDAFRIQFDALITKIKEDLCREVDAKADGLFGLLQEEWDRQMQTTGDHVVVKNEENNGNAGDDTVSGLVKVEDESMKIECECDSESEWDIDEETDEDIEVKKEEPEDDDNGEHDDVNDNERMGDDEGDDPVETNQAMFDEEDVVTNTVDGNESAVDHDDASGDEHDDDEGQAEAALAGSGDDAPSTQRAPIPNEPVLQVASNSGPRCSNRTFVKRRQITPDVASSDEEDGESEGNRTGQKRKKARVETAPITRDRPHQEDTVDQEDSKQVITISLNCTVAGCTKKFRHKTQLIEHLKRKHRIDRYPCHIRGCTVSFPTQPKLTEHLRSAHGSLTRWPCGHCALQCTNYHHLSNHVFQYHELGRFVCGHAGCNFPASTYRRKVMDHQRQHKTATHLCTFAGCGMAFKQSDSLKRHTRMHTGERPFFCDHCQKAFTRKPSLTDHIRTQHTHIGERPFVCDQCQKTFTLNGGLTRHVRTKH